ncbi:MAG: sel1 repeat family protein [Clostridia bacterium]|nr:sel1 repeat family protein [Clostridia bacterium]
MHAYICVTHAACQLRETEILGQALARYGFRYACISELTEARERGELLSEASLLIAHTSVEAENAETVASDIRRALERGMPVLCVSREENELDQRFCGMGSGAVLIPLPLGETPDRHSIALFIHRLFVRHLSARSECFSAVRCADDVYGRTILHAASAHKGDPEACYGLGRAYEEGIGVPRLENEAARWIAEAAEADHPDARIRMGEISLVGRGTVRDPHAAVRLFTRAAEAGDLRGHYHLGLCYLSGQGVMKDPERAVDELMVAAEGGYAPATYRLGLLFRDGIGTRPCHAAAVRLIYTACRAALSESDLTAALSLSLTGRPAGRRYVGVSMRQLRRTRLKPLLRASLSACGKAVTDDELEERVASCFGKCRITAVSLPEDAVISSSAPAEGEVTEGADAPVSAAPASAFDLAEACCVLGALLARGDEESGFYPDLTRALVWYRLSWRLGYPNALYRMGDAYRRGHGLPSCPDRAYSLFRLADGMGDEPSRFALGVCYEQGIGTAPDPQRAFAYYEASAQAGYAPAQNNLGGCYEYGVGTVQDLHAATEWYARAAAEVPAAACRLGMCYEQGRGVDVDPLRAFRLYETAAEAGYPYAKYRLGLCYDQGVKGESRDVTDPDLKGDAVTVSPDYVRGAHLFEEAARDGVADAAYALSLCYRVGHGVRRDEGCALACLREAAEGGSIPACYAMGLSHLEGDCVVQNAACAVDCFAKAAALWAESHTGMRREARPEGILAREGVTLSEAAGGALYMLGYCVLYGIGDEAHPALRDRDGAVTQTERISLAADYFREASRVDHVGALTALGDLYSYGLLTPETATAEDEALRYYMEAARVGASREFVSDSAEDSPIDALMSLVEHSTAMAEKAVEEEDLGAAELARVQAWRSLAACAEEGSVDAYVTMAACAWHGYGTPENPDAAMWFLSHASEAHKGRVTASLWLGDLYRMGKRGDASPEEAERAYLKAIQTPGVESECGRYTLRERREARKKRDTRARSEALYRLATLRAVNGDERKSTERAFPLLVKAILMGHTVALDDWARIYTHESARLPSPFAKETASHRRSRRETRYDLRGGASHEGWMTNYYTALWLVPDLFRYGMTPGSVPEDRPTHATAEVTDTMRAACLNYLGDCLYYGIGLPADTTAAADCYRRVVSMRIPVPRGGTPPAGMIWAWYSYGWCLLRGVGTAKDPRSAVRFMTMASKYHAEAAYCLGTCYEEGRGVDVADQREAIKYYRKALKLGYRKAAFKVAELEKKLRTEA